MGFKDFFTSLAGGFSSRPSDKLSKNIARLTNQNVQHEDRLRAAEILSEIDTEESILGLLKRYDMSLEKGYMDQDEKVFVRDLVVSKSKRAVPAIKIFFKQSDNVNWPERILSHILNDDKEVISILLEIIESERDSGDMKAQKRAKLLSLLVKYEDERIPDLVTSFLKDFDETVRFTAIEVLDTQGVDTKKDILINLMIGEEEESIRVKRRILESFVRHAWSVSERKEEIQNWLPEGFILRNDRIVEI